MVTSTETRLAEGVYAHYTRANAVESVFLPRAAPEKHGAGIVDCVCTVQFTVRVVGSVETPSPTGFVGANCVRPRPSGTPSGVPPPHEWGG